MKMLVMSSVINVEKKVSTLNMRAINENVGDEQCYQCRKKNVYFE